MLKELKCTRINDRELISNITVAHTKVYNQTIHNQSIIIETYSNEIKRSIKKTTHNILLSDQLM